MLNREPDDSMELVRAISTAIRVEVERQRPTGKIDMDRVSVAAITAMVRWARAHPLPGVNYNGDIQ